MRTNLGPACLRDHTVKHRAGWTVGTDTPGITTWHSPLGGHYKRRGEFLTTTPIEPPPDPNTGPDTAPETDMPPTTIIDGPILSRPPPPPTPTEPEVPAPDISSISVEPPF